MSEPTLRSVSFDRTGWTLHGRDKRSERWTDSDGDVLSFSILAEPPRMPPPAVGPEPIRNYFRRAISGPDGGIVEVDPGTAGGLDCIRSVSKLRMRPRGFAYVGTCVVPRRDFAVSFHIHCLELGTTGMREAVVMATDFPSPEIEELPQPMAAPGIPGGIATARIKGWFRDPYDPAHDATALRCPAGRRSVRRGFWLVLGLRMALGTVCFPACFPVDLFAGLVTLLLVGIAVAPWGPILSDDVPVLRTFDGQPEKFLFILAMTLAQGAAVAALFAGMTYMAAEFFRGMTPDAEDADECERCGYDLRATPGRCPECGMVPEAVRVGRGLVGRGGGTDNPRP